MTDADRKGPASPDTQHSDLAELAALLEQWGGTARLRELIRERPLSAIALAVASGVLLASIVRR